MWNFLRERGFSLPELMIGLGISAVAVLGGAKLITNLEKSKSYMTDQTDYLMVQKLIEAQLVSPSGCHELEGATVGGSELQFGEESNMPFKDRKAGNINITGLKVKSFTPMEEFDEGAQSGLVEVELKLQKKADDQEVVRNIPVSVIVKDNVIQGCNYELTRQFIEIRDELCSRTYNLADNLNCDQVIIHLRNASVESICQDIYGDTTDKPAKYQTIGTGLNAVKHCRLNLIHAAQTCGTGYIDGFDANGVRTCKAAITYPAPPTCTEWGNWSPLASTECKDRPLTQTRSCLQGMSKTLTRTTVGTRDDASCCVPDDSSWTPAQPFANVCTSQPVVETNNCGTTRQENYGTKTDGACCVVSEWKPAPGVNPADVCTTATYKEVNNCGLERDITNGTKDCSVPQVALGECNCFESACMTNAEEHMYTGKDETRDECVSKSRNLLCTQGRDPSVGKRYECRWDSY